MVVLKVILIILLTILLLILGIVLLALIMPVAVSGRYIDGKAEYKIKYAFITIFSSDNSGIVNKLIDKPKKTKKKKIKKSNKKDEQLSKSDDTENSEQTEKETVAEVSEKKSESSKNIKKDKKKKVKTKKEKKPLSEKLEKISEIWELITQIWEIATKPIRKILKSIHFDKIYIDFKISDTDAYDCALKYGKMCILVYDTLALADQIFSLTKESIEVKCIFNEEKSIYNIGATVRFHPIAIVASAIPFLWLFYFKIYKPKKKQERINLKPAKAVTEVKNGE